MFKNGKWLLIIIFLLLIILASVVTSYAADYTVVYNASDATSNINSAIQSAVNNPGNDRVVLTYQGTGTKWISGPLELYNDVEFVLEAGVILEAKSGAIPNGTPFILINGRTNVKITGSNSIIKMLIDEYTVGEWRHCVSIRSCTDVTIEGVTLQKSGGDGIYLGSNGTANNNIVIQNVICDGNARNGIAIISGENITITNCSSNNTGQYNPTGLASEGPWAGIDFEPNYATEKLENIAVTNCTFDNNKKYGLLFCTNVLQSANISVDECIIKNCESGITSLYSQEGTTGVISIDSCTIENTKNYAIIVGQWAYNGRLFSINNCTIIDPVEASNCLGAIIIDSSISATYSTGNINVNNTYVLKNKSPYALKLLGGNTAHKLKNISGTIYTDQINASIYYSPYCENINIPLYILNVSFNNAFSSDADGVGGTDSDAFFTDSTAKVYSGDYNGDGKTDLFLKGYGTYRALYLANSTGDGFTCAFQSDADGVGGTDYEAFFTSSSAKIYTGDYNGDGKTDLFLKGYGTYRSLYLANATGDGFTRKFNGTDDGVGGTDNEAFFTDPSAMLYTGDFNGDGKTDLFLKGYGTSRALYLANSTGDGFECAFQGDADGIGGTDSETFFTDASANIYTGDYNGDGKTDLFVKGYGTARALYLANSAGNGFVRAFYGTADGVGGTDSEAFFTNASAKLYTGDYNADGKTDFFVKGYSTTRALYLANSTGDGFNCAFQGSADAVGGTDNEAFFTDASANIYTGDYNGDGKTDLFVKGYGTVRALYLANSEGNGFGRTFLSSADGVGGTDSEAFFTDASANIYTGDYNGDGKTDLFLKGYLTWRALYIVGGTY